MTRPFSPPTPPWTSADCAACVGISPRAFSDLFREGEAPIPQPFAKAGNAYLWDELQFRAALPKLREWLDGATDRATARRRANIKEQEELFERRKAELERDAKRMAEQHEMFRAAEKKNEREQEASRKTGTPIILDPNSRRAF